MQPSNAIPEYLSKRNENRYPHRDLYVKVHSGIIHKSQKNGNNPNECTNKMYT